MQIVLHWVLTIEKKHVYMTEKAESQGVSTYIRDYGAECL